MNLLEYLSQITDLTQSILMGAILVFVRVSAVIALLPGFGEQTIPMRIKLAVALAFAVIVWPMLQLNTDFSAATMWTTIPLILSEAFIGTLIGLSTRMMLIALQFAGTIASQSASLAQMMGASATPDPMPAIGNILVMGGLVLAFSAGLHLKAIGAIVHSYDVLPLGDLPTGADVANWGVAKSADVFGLAFTLSAPFVIASFAYNVTLGVINRAMPQLMVAFIGAPAITAGGILILLISSPVLLGHWNEEFDRTLASPLGYPQ